MTVISQGDDIQYAFEDVANGKNWADCYFLQLIVNL